MSPKKKASKKKETCTNVSHLLNVPDGKTCIFCLSNEDVEEEYGKFIKKCGLQVHYFCMLFASGLCQRGKTEEHGIFGFLPEDIIKEIRRGSRLRCSYCKTMGSTIGCVISSCSRKFHLGCGRKNGTLHQFFGSFRSFCPEHRPRQLVPISDRLAFYGTANAPCAICMNSVEARASNDTLRAPCCRNSWFHRTCIQKHASTAGLYFFKCPLCNNKEMFQNEMLEYGIYIPDQDAAWETEPNAYNELMERYLNCDAILCRCPNGRKYNRDGGKWEIITCDWCGSKGTHEACHSLIKVGRHLVCQECKEIDDKSRKLKKEQKKKRTPLKKRLNMSLEKKEEIDLEQKAKSEYPGPSSGLVKPDLPQPPVVSPGMILRLSYQETDDEVDVVEDDSSMCLSPPLSITKERKTRLISAALGSAGKRRGRSRHRKKSRSRSSSSEHIPLSSVRHRLRSASRGASRSCLKSRSRSSSLESPFNSRLRSASKKRTEYRSRSSSVESLINSKLRSASRGRKRSSSRGRKRQRSPSLSDNYVMKRLRSSSCGRQLSRPSSPKSPPAKKQRRNAKTRSVSCGRLGQEYDEIDGELPKPRERRKYKRQHPFSYSGYKCKRKRRSSKKMLISMEPDLSELSPVAQQPCSPQLVGADSSMEEYFSPPKLTKMSTPKCQSNSKETASTTGTQNLVTTEAGSCIPVGSSDEKNEVHNDLTQKRAAKLSITPKKNLKLNKKQSPKGSLQQKQGKKYQKKKYKLDSNQTFINQWFKTGGDCKKSNKENNHNKYLTIEYHGKKFIKMIMQTCDEKDKILSPVSKTSHVMFNQQSSPTTRSSQKASIQPSPNTRASALRGQSPSVHRGQSPSVHRGQSPVTACFTVTTSPVTKNTCITMSPSPLMKPIRSSPRTCTSLISEEILLSSVQKLTEKKSSVTKSYPLRNSPKTDNGNVRCSLTSKFVENNSLTEDGFPIIRSILEDHRSAHNSLIQDSPSGREGDQSCMIVEVETLNSSGSSETLDYMDDDFLTSDDSDKETSDIKSPYVIKTYENVTGLEQVKVVLPGS